MKKQFQSKSVPRGTRTIWRYLGALFILFTFGIGQMWAADPDVDFTMSTSTKGNYFKNYTVGTNTVTISTSAGSISSGNGGYYIDLGSNSSVFSTNYLGVKVTGGATISKVEILASGSGNNKSITAPVVGWEEGWDGSGTTADAGLTLSYTTPGSNGSKFSTAEWREANVASWGATEVRIYKKLSSVTVTGYTLPTTAETIRIWGVRVYLATGGGLDPSAAPTITAQPSTSAAQYFTGATAAELSVAATGSGTLTYQWYSNTTASNAGGTVLENCTTATYTPSTAAAGVLYYYCAVTNTESGKSAKTVKSNASGAITVIAAPTHLVENRLNVTSGDWSSTIYTNNPTNITSLTEWQIAAGQDRTAGVTDKQSIKNGRTHGIGTTSAKVDGYYMYLSFTIASGKRLKLSAVNIPVFGISASKTTEVEIEDANSTKISVNGTITQDADGNGFGTYDFTNAPYLEGAVTMKMWAYGATSGYRMKTPIYLDGAISDIPAVSAPSISAPDADQAAVYDLNDVIAPLEITASGYPTPTYQWYSNSSASTTGATAIEGAQSASYTPANDVASDLYYYCVATNSQGSATSHYFHVAVNAPAVPTIYTETTALTLTSNKIATASETFTFSGANLGETAVTLVLASAVDGLTLSESSVTPTAGAIADTEITVSYKSLLDVAETDVNLYLKQGDDILKTIVLTYSSTAGIESLTSISAATTWDWNGAADAAYGTLGQNDMIVLANADVTWDAGFNALAIAGKLQHYYRDSKYAQGHELKFNTTIPGRVTVTFSNTGGKDIARAPRITDVNGTYAPTAEEDGSKNTTAKTYSHNVAAGDVLIAGFEMQTGTPANMLRYYKVEFVPTYTVAYAANGGSGDMTDANAYVAGDEVTLLANTFTPATGFVWSGWTVKDANNDDVAVSEGKFTMPASNVTVTAQWDDASKVAVIVETSAKYESLADAVAAATDGQTIQLLQNNNVTAQVEVAGKAITLDLAGHKIEYTGSTTLTSGVILVHNGASLTINDSSDPDAGSIVSGDKAYAAVALTKLGDDPSTPATLVVNGGALTGYYYGITGNGSRNNTVITINGGTITGTVGIAIYHPQVGTLMVNNGSLTGVDAAIEMRAGTLVINDGTFTATATEFSCNPNGSGSTTSGAAIAIAQHTTKKDISVTINGGTFNGVKALNESNPQVNDPAPQVDLAVTGGDFTGAVSTVDVDHFISGGTYDAPVTNENCAEGFVPSPVNPVTGKYSVEPKDGTSLIKAVATAKSQDIEGANLTGVFKGAAHIETSNDYKMDTKKYFMVQLVAGQNFQAGDIVKINVSAVNDCNGFTIYSDIESDGNFIPANLIIDTHDGTGAAAKVSAGINEVKLPETFAGSNKLYVGRASGADKYLNAGINQVEVTRAMNPQLLAITIDGRDGVINEAAKTVAVQIPYEADLANLTIVPTIAWNAPATENSIVVNNGSAWVEDDNTYKLTDKDGDYTVYTITLTRDVLKHTVSFNTHGGSAVANVLVEHNAYLTAVPNDPSKEDYIFQYWSLTDGGDEVDITTVQIDEDKEFHAVWASEGAIKLFDGEGNLNTTNFISPAKTTIEIADVEHVCLAEFSSNRSSSLAGATPTDMVKYDATTDEAKIKITFYNSNSGIKKAVLYKFEEGAEAPEKIEIEVPGQEIWTTEYYTFNSSKNRSFYVCMNDRSYIRVLQVKVVDNGANPVKQFGQVGYSLNLNKGRFYAKAAVEKNFEGFTFTPSSEYKVYNNSNLATTSANSFTIASPTVMSVKRSGGKYYVYQDPADKGTLYTADAEIELNTTGTWYISSETGSSAASFTKIEFLAPKCEKPTITTQPATKQTFDPGNLTATVVATVSDGGTLKYQWYNASNDEEVEGATEATLTTTTAGTYYVIVTNTLADHRDNSVKSEEATLGYRVTTDATLSALSASAGTLDPAFAKDVLEYRVDLPEGTTVVPTLSATATMDGYATVAINNATAFVNYEATSTVVVTSEDATANKTYTVKFYVDHLLPQVDVTESTTWNWTYAAEGTVTIKVTDSTEPIKKNEEGLMANVRVDDNKPTNDATFNSQALLFYGENVRAKDGGRWYASLGHIKFNVTKPGIVEVEFSDNGSNNRCLSINGFMSPKSSSKTDIKTFKVFVPAGEVTLMGMEGAETDKYIRISKITYTVKESPDYWRNVSSNYGTLCVEHNVLVGGAMGATFYQIASRNEDYDYKIDFEEVLPNEELKAGEPYLFKSNTGKIELFFSETTSNVAPIEVRGMIGNYAATTLAIDESNMSTTYYFANNKLWSCENLVGVGLTLNEHRAYIDFTDVPTYADYEASKQQQQNSAPRRRVSLEMNGEKIATGCENLNVSDKPVKMIINGQLFILRGEKMYDAKGQLVK